MDDLIRRSEAIRIASGYCHWTNIPDELAKLPSVSTEKTGRWIKIKPYPLQMHEYECSECLYETDDNTEKYCSGCGAKMEVVK